MRKKYSKQKELKPTRDRRCHLCALPHAPQLLLRLPTNNLHSKYLHPQLQTYHYRTANNFIYDAGSSEAIAVVEMTKLIHRDEHLSRYYSFAETVQSIRSVIHRRVEKDFYGCVDFQEDHFHITNLYYMRRKQLVQNNKRMQKYLTSTMSTQSTGSGDDRCLRAYFQNKIKKELDNERLVKLTQNETNSSTIDMQRLGRHLEHMIEKITDLSCIRPLRGKGRAERKVPQNNISMLFKLSNCGEISVISKNREDVIMPVGFEEPQDYQESYGLETIRPKNSSKKVNKLTLRSMEKINGFEDKPPPQTPKPRFFHTGNEYEEIELNKPGQWNRSGRLSKDKKIQPMSPGNNRSSSLSQPKSLSRNGSQISRKAK